MKKNIWIINHYATDMYFNEGGRHYSIAENLKKRGYNPVIICASTTHNVNENIKVDNRYDLKYKNDIPYIFIKCRAYKNNGISRVLNITDFYKNLMFSSKKISKNIQNPDIIYASSVHPLALVAGIKLSDKFKIPTISEVRDLWPESLVAYGKIKKNNVLTKAMYLGEKWIYKKSNKIIMTWEGGFQYIKDKGWEKEINLSKIEHICNGILLSDYEKNLKNNKFIDQDFPNKKYFECVYTGAIREVNDLDFLLDVSKKVSNQKIRINIFGNGDEVERLKKRISDENISNCVYRGVVEKNKIPSILEQSDLTILHNKSTSLNKYGQSQNKLFEYLASKKPVYQTYPTEFNIIERANAGWTAACQNTDQVAAEIDDIFSNIENFKEIGENAYTLVQKYDYKVLTDKLIKIIEST